MIASGRRRAFRLTLFVTFLVVLALASGRQLAMSPSHGQDFRDFYAAASLVARGGDPYDVVALAREQDRLYNQPAHLKPGDPAFYDSLPYPQGPWVAIALVPSTALPWQAAYGLYLVSALAAIAAAAWAFLRLLGWSGRAQLVAVGATLLSPIAFVNLFQGQPVPFLLAAFAGAWFLLRHGRPALAGALLAIAWIKPHVGLPLVVVLGLLEPAAIRLLLIGFAAGTVTLFGLAAAVMHGALLEWPKVVLGQWSGALQQADLASINAFYYPAVHGALRQAGVALVLTAAAAYLWWTFRQSRSQTGRAFTLLLLTFLAAPYAHSYDTLLLLPVTLAALGPRLRGWADPATEAALWAFAIFPILYFAGFHLGFFNGFTAIAVIVLGLAWHRRRSEVTSRTTVAAAA